MSHFAAAGGGVDDDDVYDEDDDPTCYDPIADFAEPIIKKKKKGLDLSKWREYVQSKDVSNIQEKDKNRGVEEGAGKQKMKGDSKMIYSEERVVSKPSLVINGSNESLPLQGTPEVAVNGLNSSNLQDEAHWERSSCDDADMPTAKISSVDMLGLRNKHHSATSEPNSISNEQGSTSLESQIDTENRALLERMSTEEIGEALTDIQNRISPEMLKMLKRRGLQKSEKQSSSCSSDDGVHALGAGKRLTEGEKESPVLETVVSPKEVNLSKLNTETGSHEGGQNLLSKGSSLWDIWSKRVEAIRTLRFSFDGNVIEGNHLLACGTHMLASRCMFYV